MKTCSECKADKPEDEFHWANKKQGRRHGYCKPCLRAKANAYKRKQMGLEADAELKPGPPHSPIGSTYTHKGYIREKVGNDASCHPRACRDGWVYQHILVAEQKYGFAIPAGLTVHHRNANKTDNRPDNLELRVGQHGKGGDLLPTLLADRDLRAQARVILAMYPGDGEG